MGLNLTEQDKRDLLVGELKKNNKIIDTGFNKSFFVEAGAGAGKTWIIVHRIVEQLITGICAPEEIVAITFTNKATEELRVRLDEELRDRAKSNKISASEKKKIRKLCDKLENMQVSTIHSFGQKLLKTMPFEHDLGMDFEVVKDIQDVVRKIFYEDIEENSKRWMELKKVGINPKTLLANFTDVIESGDVKLKYPELSEALKVKQELINVARIIHAEYVVGLQNLLAPNEKEVALLNPEFLKILRKNTNLCTDDELLNLSQMLIHDYRQFLPSMPYNDEVNQYFEEFKKILRIKDRGERKNQISIWSKISPYCEAMAFAQEKISECNSTAKSTVKKPVINITRDMRWNLEQWIHYQAMKNYEELLEKVELEKRRLNIADNNDLLIKSKNMLRDSKFARAYFREKYKCIYVDEFQDTDPEQAELLFYLTTEEKDFNKDWRKCKPRAGSLFVVGDPKQAIYRFRNADIQIYKQVKNIFECGIGEVIILQDNYRSSTEICDFVDDVFDPGKTGGSGIMKGDTQATYTSMIPAKKNRAMGIVKSFGEHKDKYDITIDPNQYVASMIKEAVNKQNKEYGDFLVLTKVKGDVERCAKAFDEQGIPYVSTGKKSYNNLEELQRLILHLNFICNSQNEQNLAYLLVRCYGYEPIELNDYMKCVGARNLLSAFTSDNNIESSEETEKELDKHARVKAELRLLRKKASQMHPMALIEYLVEGGFGIWSATSYQSRKKEFSRLQQILNMLRIEGKGSLSDYAKYLEKVAQGYVEHILPIDEEINKVKIMNIHKAKGLEGKIVVLLPGSLYRSNVTKIIDRSSSEATQTSLVFRPAGDKEKYLGNIKGWEELKKVEKDLGKEEYHRLLYVAATRAQEELLIFRESKKTYWKPLEDQVNKNNKVAGTTGNTKPTFVKDSSYLPIKIEDTKLDSICEKLDKQQKICKETNIYHITPSTLDHATPPRKNEEGLREPDPQVENIELLSDENKYVFSEQEKAVLEEFGYDTSLIHTPYGTEWGTMVHRALELLVRYNEFNNIAPYARQAVYETLDCGAITVTSSKELFGKVVGEVKEEQISLLAGKIEAQISFIKDENHELRQLMRRGVCFPELDFCSFLTDGEIYDRIQEYMSKKQEEIQGKDFEVEGIVDLAIMTENGWIIVDYKTNKLKTGETRESYKERMHKSYDNQIQAYGKLLDGVYHEKQDQEAEVYICSIPLNGEIF